MRLLILSDLHGNRAALEAIREECDAVVCLGDLVDYGPDPAFCVEAMRARAQWRVPGNHDHAAAYGTEPHCSPRYLPLALETLDYTRGVLSEEQLHFLAEPPLRQEFEFGGARFACVHAAPSDPLYRYLPPETPDSVLWGEVEGLESDYLLLGHTHRPLARRVGDRTVFNPGSVGQPSDGDPRASYGIWQDGHLEVRRVEYPVEETLAALGRIGLSGEVFDSLAFILRTGRSLGR